MEMRSLEECRALLGAAAEGLSDARVLDIRDEAYRIAFGLVAAYTAVDTPYLTQDQRRALKGLPPQRRPKRKQTPTNDQARQSSPSPVSGTGSPRSSQPEGAEP